MMKKRVHVPAGRRDAVERMAFQELAAQLYAKAVRPAEVGSREDLASVREGRRHVGFASRVAHTNDERTVIALNPHRFIDAAAAVRAADVVRLAEARFNEEPRDACGEYRAALEIIVREGKVAVVANKGRADEAAIAVIAARVNAERRAELPAARANHRAAAVKIPLGVGFDQLNGFLVRIR